MTIAGTVHKIVILALCVVLAAAWVWFHFIVTGDPSVVYPYLLIGSIGGLGVALATTLQTRWAPVSAPIYALLEGLVVGGGVAYFETVLPGVVAQAVLLTFSTLFALLAAYRIGWIRATETFKAGVLAATGGIALAYIADLALSLFGQRLLVLHQSGLIGVLISLAVVGVAAFNLVLDFDFIQIGARDGAPAYMEWYAAFGLIVTLIWIYMEILRLLIILQSDND